MGHAISRRRFIVLGVGAVAWACGRERPSGTAASPGADDLSVVQVAPDIAVGDTRMAFALFESDRAPFDPPGMRSASVQLKGPSGEPPAPIVANVQEIRFGMGGEDHEHAGGEEHDHSSAEVHRIFVFQHPFEQPGVWTLEAEVVDGGTKRGGTLSFQVSDTSPSPMVGQKAVVVESPTFGDHRGVDPICTRTPECPMHDVTIAQALSSGKPAVITFATPKYCTSRTCGPVVDIVEAAKKEVGDAAHFVHVEVWKDEAAVGKEPAPAFAAWKLQSEPWVFFVASDGTVKQRWSGAVGDEETRQAVRELVAGKL